MKLITAPEPVSTLIRPAVFFGGAIDNGAAADWQAELAAVLVDLPGTLLNPRRREWNADWPQDPAFAPFREQVQWELDGLDLADVIVMHFPATAKAPVSLLELGLHAAGGKLLVCCEPGYWRAGNVRIVCDRYAIPVHDDLAALRAELLLRIS